MTLERPRVMALRAAHETPIALISALPIESRLSIAGRWTPPGTWARRHRTSLGIPTPSTMKGGPNLTADAGGKVRDRRQLDHGGTSAMPTILPAFMNESVSPVPEPST